jgi:hypothetical protein
MVVRSLTVSDFSQVSRWWMCGYGLSRPPMSSSRLCSLVRVHSLSRRLVSMRMDDKSFFFVYFHFGLC